MSEQKSWLQRNGAAMIAILMLGGLVALIVLNVN